VLTNRFPRREAAASKVQGLLPPQQDGDSHGCASLQLSICINAIKLR
jgi:hypothetical protein